MANQNLSQFGEKLFVADADHTFIWDSAASISKRVSRNSWLNSGTLTSDAPVTISQTWNNAAVAFTGLKVNAVSTASASGSLLADFQVGGVSQFSVSKVGAMVSAFSITSSYIQSNANFVLTTDAGAVVLGATPDTWLRRDGAPNTLALRNGAAAQTFNVYGTSSASNANYARLALTCGLDGNATISTQALGTGTAGTVSINGVPVGLGKGNVSSNISIGAGILSNNVSGSNNIGIGNFTLTQVVSSTNNTAIGISALQFAQLSNNIGIGYFAGTYRSIGGNNFAQSNNIYIGANTTSGESGGGSNEMVFGAAAAGIGSNSVVLGNDSITKTALKGNVGIGTTSPTSKLDVVGDVNASGSITSSTNIYAGTNGYLFISGRSAIGSSIAGGHTLLDNGGSFYNRLNLGGNTNLFPAIKRVGAELQIVIASTTSAAGVAAPDADMAFIEDRYRRKGAGTPEGVVTAPIGAVYHNTTGGVGTSFYVKESGTGNTGWVGK